MPACLPACLLASLPPIRPSRALLPSSSLLHSSSSLPLISPSLRHAPLVFSSSCLRRSFLSVSPRRCSSLLPPLPVPPHCTSPASRAGQSLPCPAALFTVHRVHSNGPNTLPPRLPRQPARLPPRPHASTPLRHSHSCVGEAWPRRTPLSLPALPAPRRAGGERLAPGARRQLGAPGRSGSVPSRSGVGVAHSLTPRGGLRLPGNPRAPVTRPLL
ncbi:hypothetical protein E2C01_056805 [Portunus trituberculatus]|uniref:Uncharacterized protein n=1 Tax=Portunus trituberculatus TaxID=210409 RepID=A0A5B7GYQ2_PORTR|nr:hypothetical protein [Portunus trituberculatus]